MHKHIRVEHTFSMLERFWIVGITSGRYTKRVKNDEYILYITSKLQILFRSDDIDSRFQCSSILSIVVCDFGPWLLALFGQFGSTTHTIPCTAFYYRSQSIEKTTIEKRSTCVYLCCKISAFCVLARLTE